jgi:hypothetical protein
VKVARTEVLHQKTPTDLDPDPFAGWRVADVAGVLG